ncbi:hypothetical protein ACWF94_40585, partial [Streptomyces sp. NPDC055078]
RSVEGPPRGAGEPSAAVPHRDGGSRTATAGADGGATPSATPSAAASPGTARVCPVGVHGPSRYLRQRCGAAASTLLRAVLLGYVEREWDEKE